MNKVILMGRLTRDPEVRWTTANGSQEQRCVARYTLAVDRRQKDGGADFPSIVVFGKGAEFAEKYFKKGTKVVITGRLTTGSYTNKDGVKVYTTDVIADDQEFAESKAAAGQSGQTDGSQPAPQTDENGFMNIPDGIEEELPFS